MKRSKKLTVIMMSLVLITSSCSKDEDPVVPETTSVSATTTTPTTPTFTSSFSVKIDGVGLSGIITTANAVGSRLSLQGTNTVESISFILPDDIPVGTYTVGGLFSSYTGTYFNTSNVTSLYASSGSLDITEHNTSSKKISGTFSFIADKDNLGQSTGQSKTITEGKFSLQY